jgi:hypothetical protein
LTFNLAVKLGLALGYLVAGILGNYLTIPLLGPAELIFTPAVFFLAIRTLPIKLAALVILAVLAHLSWHWDSLHNSTLFLLECCVYWWACRKGWNVFFADLGFWLLLGLPLAFAMLSFSDIESFELVPVLLLKQPVNALAYLLLTNLLLWLKIFRNQQLCLNSGADTQASSDVRFLSIEQVLRDALLLMLLIPIFLGVYLTKNNIDKQYSKKLSSLTSSYALATKVQLDEFLLRHQQGIEALAKVLFEPKESRQNEMQRILVEFHKLYDGFITMLIAHPDGSLWLSSPPELMVSGVSISDRSYFRQPRETLEALYQRRSRAKVLELIP